MFDREGHLWLLECDSANAVRVRRMDHAGAERILMPTVPTDARSAEPADRT
jgi:hypothetical protein